MPNYYPSSPHRPDAADRPRPVSEKQLAANRANALKSTGPKTIEGKGRVRTNAFKHGLTGQYSVFGVDESRYREKFLRPFMRNLAPANQAEKAVAIAIAEGYFRLARARAIEDNIFGLAHYTDLSAFDLDNHQLHQALTLARAWLEASGEIERITLYEQRILRAIERHRAELTRLPTERKQLEATAPALAAVPKPRRIRKAPVAAQPEPSSAPAPLNQALSTTSPAVIAVTPSNPNGFVFSNDRPEASSAEIHPIATPDPPTSAKTLDMNTLIFHNGIKLTA